MAAPKYEIVQKQIQNPHASAPLFIPILVLCNTLDEDLERNIRANTARDLRWLAAKPEHKGVAVLVGGGPSLRDQVEEIRFLQQQGATVFAINAASAWLNARHIAVDYQVIADAKDETASLVDPLARAHLFASQVSTKTMEAAPAPIVWHLAIDDVEEYFPPQRRVRGGYALIGGGHTGNSALCVAYAMGFRDLHIFGYDSSHRDDESHAYRQSMNDFIPTVEVEWAGRSFTSSVAMKGQAEKFRLTAQALREAGVTLSVYGDGLLQHMHRAPIAKLTERDKYRLMWQFDTYREVSPGELTVDAFISVAEPKGVVIDFGCGTGRAGLALNKRGLDVLLVDFADNCRDDEALGLPFLEWDLTKPCPAHAPYGFCADVMEHIPPADTEAALAVMFASAERMFFRIGRDHDECGALIGHTLHLALRTHAEWRALMAKHGEIVSEAEGEDFSVFYVIGANHVA